MPSRFLAAAFATAFLATAAHADDRTVCATSSDPAAVIVACGKIIANEKEPADVRAIAHADRGYAHQRNKDYDTAIADYDVAITLNPKLARAYFNRGVAYYRKSDAQHAMSNFSEAIRLDPKDPEPYVNR